MVVGRGRRHRRRRSARQRRRRTSTALDSTLVVSTAKCPTRPMRVDARRVPVHLVERAGQAIDQPRLAVEVVHREDPARRQVRLRRLHRSRREQVALETQRRLARDERERVRQREQDQVVALVRALEERAAVGDVHVDPRIVVRMLGIELASRARRGAGRSRPRRRARRRWPARWRRRRRCRRRRSSTGAATVPARSYGVKYSGSLARRCAMRLDRLMRDPVDGHLVRAVGDRERRDLVVRRPRRVRGAATPRPASRRARRPIRQHDRAGRGSRARRSRSRPRRAHAIGGVRRNDSAENAAMPTMLPTMSSRYASSGSNVAKVRATPSAIIAIMAATAQEHDRQRHPDRQPGRARRRRRSAARPSGRPATGTARTKTTRNASAGAAHGNSGARRARRAGSRSRSRGSSRAGRSSRSTRGRRRSSRPADQGELDEEHQEAQTHQTRPAGTAPPSGHT